MHIPAPEFPLSYQKAKKRLANFDPTQYSNTRNDIEGGVSYLSPYITRGALTLPQLRDHVLENHSLSDVYKYIFELAWREYYQNVWRDLGTEIYEDISGTQDGVRTRKMIKAVKDANTEIETLDQTIKTLKETGYMHNHARMWIGGLTTNIAGAHWWQPSLWLYHHLLDGDPASNMLSWQSVAGTFTGRAYLPAQSNINKYSPSEQTGTYLDHSYEKLGEMSVPDELSDTVNLELKPHLPESDELRIKDDETVYVYHPFSLDPDWHKGKDGARVLVIDPEFYKKLPVSENVMNFITGFAKENIPEIQIYVGAPEDFFADNELVYKSHPYTKSWPGSGEDPEKLFPEVSGFYSSFSKFWEASKPYLDQYD